MRRHGSKTHTQTGISSNNYQKQLIFENILLRTNVHMLQKAISQ